MGTPYIPLMYEYPITPKGSTILQNPFKNLRDQIKDHVGTLRV